MRYESIPKHPGGFSGPAALVRMIDGIGFRYRWATEGLKQENMTFQPCEGSFSLHGLLGHIWRLLAWLNRSLEIEPPSKDSPTSLEGLRSESLEMVWALRERLAEFDDKKLDAISITVPGRGEFPFWNMINGPLCDILTHIGQINSWRRMAGNPPLKANPFLGIAPGME